MILRASYLDMFISRESLLAGFLYLKHCLTWRPRDRGELAHWQVGWSPPRSPWSGSSGWSRCGWVAPRGRRRRERSGGRRGRRRGRRWRRRWRWKRRQVGERGGGAAGAGTQTFLLQSISLKVSLQCECLPGKAVRATVGRAGPRWWLLLWPLAPTWPPPMELYMGILRQIYVVLLEEKTLLSAIIYIKISYHTENLMPCAKAR